LSIRFRDKGYDFVSILQHTVSVLAKLSDFGLGNRDVRLNKWTEAHKCYKYT